MVIRTVIALLGGALIGGAGAWLVNPTGPPPGPPPCEQSLKSAKQANQTLETELQTLSEVYDQRWRKRVAAIGQTLAWPEQVPPALTPDAIRAHVQTVMDRKSGELLELDCSAYPCVAIVRWRSIPEEMEIISSSDDGALFPASMMSDLSEHADYNGRPMVDVGQLDNANDGTSIHAFAWYDAEDIRMAKREAAANVQVDGNRLDQIRGRNEAVFDSWTEREQP